MAETTTITVRIPVELRDRLDRLAKAMERSRSYVATEAIEIYARYETEILDGLEEAEADVEAGRSYSSEQMNEELERLIAETQPKAEPKRKKAAGA